jgi:hypothetical protein
MEKATLSEKKEDFSVVLYTIENIIESEKVGRFKFTSKEQSALQFVVELLSIHIKDLERY